MRTPIAFAILSFCATAYGSPPEFTASTPELAGPFRRVFVPSNGRYLNDHTLVRGPDHLWHLFSIAHTSKGSAFEEKSLLHATAKHLNGPWTEHADVLQADPTLNELVTWAPHVVEWAPDRWIMFYWAEWTRPEPTFRGLRRADSIDLYSWVKAESGDDPSIRPPGGRDPYLMKFGDKWLLYSVGVTGSEGEHHGQIVLTEAADISNARAPWSQTVAVTTDPVPSFGWGNLESPFVKEHRGWFYLFTTRTGPHDPDVPAEYLDEVVLRSRDPRHFDWRPIATFTAHASEIVNENGVDYITSAGWTSVIGEENRGLKIAPLRWRRP